MKKIEYTCDICGNVFKTWDERRDPDIEVLSKPNRNIQRKQRTVNKPIWFDVFWDSDLCDDCLGLYLRKFLVDILKYKYVQNKYNLPSKYHSNAIAEINKEINELIEEVERK